jgi:hypothetical protein
MARNAHRNEAQNMSFHQQTDQASRVVSRFPDAPPSIAKLPLDKRGFPVPYFVQWIDGEPDFRVADTRRMGRCVRERRCWICGGKLGRMFAFTIGPMCAVNRVSAEPPEHPLCAAFAVKACPFLTRPLAKRPGNEDLKEKHANFQEPPGTALLHNPGVTLVWHTLRYSLFEVDNGTLFEIGEPARVSWWREGREATRDEVLEGFSKGLPTLRATAEEEGPEAVADFDSALRRAMTLLPA